MAPVSRWLDWGVHLTATPTLFLERAGSSVDADGSRAAPAHLAASTAFFLSTGPVFGF
jgi:hypothetical protein